MTNGTLSANLYFNKVGSLFFVSLFLAGNETIPESAFCGMLESGRNGFPIWEVSTLSFFIIPMTVILVLYVRIGMRIRARTKHTQALGELGWSLFYIKSSKEIWRRGCAGYIHKFTIFFEDARLGWKLRGRTFARLKCRCQPQLTHWLTGDQRMWNQFLKSENVCRESKRVLCSHPFTVIEFGCLPCGQVDIWRGR